MTETYAPNHFENFYLLSSTQELDKDDILAKGKQAQSQADFTQTFRGLLDKEITMNQISLKKGDE